MSEPYDPLVHNPTFYRSSLPGSKPPAQLASSDHDAISPRTTLGLENNAQILQGAPNPASLKIQKLQQTLDETTGIMAENIKSMDERGERLDHINERAGQLSITSQSFRRSATDVRKRMWWKNMKWWICIGFFVLFLIGGSVAGAIEHKKIVEVIQQPATSEKLPLNPIDGSTLGPDGRHSPIADLAGPGPIIPAPMISTVVRR